MSLGRYFAPLFLLCSSLTMQAAHSIIYTPYGATTVSGVDSAFYINIDQSGGNDFVIRIEHPSTGRYDVIIDALTAYGSIETNGSFNASIYGDNQLLPSSATFQSHGYLAVDPGNYAFDGVGAAYIHVQMSGTGVFQQGYIRLDIPTTANSFTIFSSGLASDDVVPITTGMTFYTGIQDVKDAAVIVSNTCNGILLHTEASGDFQLLDVTGRLLLQQHFESGTQDIRLDAFNSSLFFIRWKDENGMSYSAKVFGLSR
jgi:hypothetical protein